MTQGRHTELTIQLTAGRTPDVASDGSVRRPSMPRVPDGGGCCYCWPRRCRSRRLPRPSAAPATVSTSGRSGFSQRAWQGWPTNAGVRHPPPRRGPFGRGACERRRAPHGDAWRAEVLLHEQALLTRSYQALIYDEIEEYEQTIADLSAHLQADPTNTHALNNRALAHGEIGHIDEALEGFRAAAAAAPTHAVPSCQYGPAARTARAPQRGHCSV